MILTTVSFYGLAMTGCFQIFLNGNSGLTSVAYLCVFAYCGFVSCRRVAIVASHSVLLPQMLSAAYIVYHSKEEQVAEKDKEEATVDLEAPLQPVRREASSPQFANLGKPRQSSAWAEEENGAPAKSR